MSCEVLSTEFGPVFVCGGDGEIQICGFCAEDGVYLCDWPVERMKDKSLEEVQVGDRFVLGDGFVGRVEYRSNAAGLVRVGVIGRGGLIKQLASRPDALFRTPVKGTCDAPCCEAHVVERGDELHYCADHWRDWESVQ